MVSCYAGLLVFDRAPQPQTLWNRVAGPSGVVLNFMERGQNPEELESFTGRTEWWHLAWTQFLSRPLTGLGAYAGGKFGVLSKSGFGDTPQLHSDYLETLVGTSFWTIVLVIGLLRWMSVARLVRVTYLQLRERDFVTAARALGGTNGLIMWRHILPNALSPLIVSATLHVAGAILTESTLSFLGLGIQLPTPTWGNMLRAAQGNLISAPWLAFFPGLFIFLSILSINYIGDGVRDAMDPRR